MRDLGPVPAAGLGSRADFGRRGNDVGQFRIGLEYDRVSEPRSPPERRTSRLIEPPRAKRS